MVNSFYRPLHCPIILNEVWMFNQVRRKLHNFSDLKTGEAFIHVPHRLVMNILNSISVSGHNFFDCFFSFHRPSMLRNHNFRGKVKHLIKSSYPEQSVSMHAAPDGIQVWKSFINIVSRKESFLVVVPDNDLIICLSWCMNQLKLQ